MQLILDKHGYETIIEPIRHRMVHSIWRIVRDPDVVEDVLQTALESICKQWKKVQQHPNPTALVLRICINAACDFHRRGKRQPQEEQLSSESLASAQPTPRETLLEAEGRKKIIATIGKLPRRQAEALTLRALEELSYHDIAQAMGCCQSTARQLVSKARQNLSKRLMNQTAQPVSEVLK
jgi:RNA polymerase sigma factor (sigma-70 family)